MAVLKSKQLPTRLSGSYILSGSNQTLHGTTTIHGNTTISGSLQNLKGSSADFRIRQDDDTTLVKLETDPGGSSALLLYDNKYHGGGNTVDINSADSTALVIKSGSSTIFTVDRDNTLISGSSTSTGSFGNVDVSGNVRGSRFEIDGATEYIDKAFGSLFIVTTGDIAAQPGTNKALKVTGGISATSHITGSKNIISTGANALISGSSTSTGSFGRIDSSGRIFEQGSSVIDHATAMAIVFGG